MRVDKIKKKIAHYESKKEKLINRLQSLDTKAEWEIEEVEAIREIIEIVEDTLQELNYELRKQGVKLGEGLTK